MELPIDSDEFAVNELKFKLMRLIEYATSCGSQALLSGVGSNMRPMVYYYRDLCKKLKVGWHYQKQEIGSGNVGHYDHGVGISKNQDLRYSYAVPYFSEAILFLIRNAAKQEINLSGMFMFKGGKIEHGRLTSTKKSYAKEDGRPTEVAFHYNRKVVDEKFVRSIVAQVPLPTKHSDIWSRDESLLIPGEKVFYHDGDKAGFGTVYSEKDNMRFQKYHGKLIAGLPLPSVNVGWCSEKQLIDFLQLPSSLAIANRII